MKRFLLCLIVILPATGISSLYAQYQGTNAYDSLLLVYNAQQEHVNTLARHRQYFLLFVGIAVLALVLLLLFFIYRYYNLQKKASMIIRAEQDRAEQQRLRAERSEQFEQQFLENMSHEIRTPMNTVMGMTNLALDTHLTPKQKKYLTAVIKSSENLLVIINNVLDRSKVDAEKMELENMQFRLSEQINQVIETMKIKAEEKGLTLQSEIASDIPDLLTGDPSRLNQVLINLCWNAIKFTDKGTVRIVVEKEPDTEATLYFKVIDSGIGVPADKVGTLFESFHDAAPDTLEQHEEKDLGLSIAKTLVELEGGEIEVKSEEGKGSEFFFTITYGVPDEKNAALLEGIRILVAEDNEYNQMVITDTLETLIKGVKVDLAENGKVAIEKHTANDYDVILMDAQMPEMNGMEATIYIRNTMLGKKKTIPIIALTAGVLNTDLYEYYEAGMNDHIPKPFTRSHLLNTLAKYYKAGAITVTNGANNNAVTKVTDLSFLQDFCKGDATAMKKYIDIYLKVTPGNLEKINNAANKNDHIILSKTIHSMKAHLNYMGMKKTRKIAETIEQYAREQNNLSELPQLIYKLQEDCERSMEELRSFNNPLS